VYNTLLTRKYLTSKVIPLLAVAGVFLGSSSILVVWSVMGGFLKMLLDSGRSHVGDVMIEWPGTGFGHYDELVEDLEARPEIFAAAPTISTMAVVQYPDKRNLTLSLIGVDADSYHRITEFRDSLWWKPVEKPENKDYEGRDLRVTSAMPALSVWIPVATTNTSARIDDFLKKDLAPEAVDALRQAQTQLSELASDARETAKRVKTGEAGAAEAFVAKAAPRYDQIRELVHQGVSGNAHEEDLYTSKREKLGDHLFDLGEAIRHLGTMDVRRDNLQRKYEQGVDLSVKDPVTGAELPSIILGVEASTFNRRQIEGYYIPMERASIRVPNGWRTVNIPIAGYTVGLTVLPSDSSGSKMDIKTQSFAIANEFKTGIYELDRGFALASLPFVQQLLRMDETDETEEAIDPYKVVIGPDGTASFDTPTVSGRSPARVTTVLVRGKEGVPLERIRAVATEAYEVFARRHPNDVPQAGQIQIQTWRDKKQALVAAVEKETIMVVLIMSIVFVAVSFLILAIFWAIVREKTRDIGILRAIGASRAGVSSLWLGYALVIGLIGAGAGVGVAHIVVWNINDIHDWLGMTLGISVWSPEIYYISKIPNEVDPRKAGIVVLAGISFAVCGALIPAIRAAYMDPVKALRFE